MDKGVGETEEELYSNEINVGSDTGDRCQVRTGTIFSKVVNLSTSLNSPSDIS
jgi:hypothetical protein